jgi:predicted esterase
MKILYIHGLESGPTGRKVSYLRRLTDIWCDQLPVSSGFEACVLQQTMSVAAYKPDIVIGSSFGGAVATELMMRKVWTGPTLLLAPAWQEIKRRLPQQITWDGPSLVNATKKVIVLHGDQDTVVPLTDSQELIRTSSSAELHVLHDTHPLDTLVSAETLFHWVQQLISP